MDHVVLIQSRGGGKGGMGWRGWKLGGGESDEEMGKREADVKAKEKNKTGMSQVKAFQTWPHA